MKTNQIKAIIQYSTTHSKHYKKLHHQAYDDDLKSFDILSSEDLQNDMENIISEDFNAKQSKSVRSVNYFSNDGFYQNILYDTCSIIYNLKYLWKLRGKYGVSYNDTIFQVFEEETRMLGEPINKKSFKIDEIIFNRELPLNISLLYKIEPSCVMLTYLSAIEIINKWNKESFIVPKTIKLVEVNSFMAISSEVISSLKKIFNCVVINTNIYFGEIISYGSLEYNKLLNECRLVEKYEKYYLVTDLKNKAMPLIRYKIDIINNKTYIVKMIERIFTRINKQNFNMIRKYHIEKNDNSKVELTVYICNDDPEWRVRLLSLIVKELSIVEEDISVEIV